jgi:hypothetical protein
MIKYDGESWVENLKMDKVLLFEIVGNLKVESLNCPIKHKYCKVVHVEIHVVCSIYNLV